MYRGNIGNSELMVYPSTINFHWFIFVHKLNISTNIVVSTQKKIIVKFNPRWWTSCVFAATSLRLGVCSISCADEGRRDLGVGGGVGVVGVVGLGVAVAVVVVVVVVLVVAAAVVVVIVVVDFDFQTFGWSG